jgi:hypothetical protein
MHSAKKYFVHTDDGGATFLRNVCSYNSHMALDPRRRHSSTDSRVHIEIGFEIKIYNSHMALDPRRRHSSTDSRVHIEIGFEIKIYLEFFNI